MKNLLSHSFLIMSFILSSHLLIAQNENGGYEQMEIYNGNEELKNDVLFGELKEFWASNTVLIKKSNGYNGDIRFKMEVSESGTDGFSEFNNGQFQIFIQSDQIEVSGELIKRVLKGKFLPNNSFIRLTATTDNEETWQGVFEARRVFNYFYRLKSPILFIPKGNIGGFSLQEFSPSLSFSFMHLNINRRKKFNYLSLDPIFTINSTVNSEVNQSGEDIEEIIYSMSLGGNIDVMGIVQVGTIYDFKVEEAFFVVGIRIEKLAELLSGN